MFIGIINKLNETAKKWDKIQNEFLNTKFYSVTEYLDAKRALYKSLAYFNYKNLINKIVK